MKKGMNLAGIAAIIAALTGVGTLVYEMSREKGGVSNGDNPIPENRVRTGLERPAVVYSSICCTSAMKCDMGMQGGVGQECFCMTFFGAIYSGQVCE